ncbi:MAG: hypothetical protein D6816_10705 [Bacteroidetes bacterium]|nr:MAG: hypothetical protein D6816_10705 [Bacteroidota bacterium]
MCVIFTQEEGFEIDDQTFDYAFESNPDGIGAIWMNENGSVETYFNLGDLDAFKEAYNTLIFQRKALIHFRFATAGEVSFQNLHPFEIAPDVWMAHNGTLNIEPGPDGESDTLMFVRQMRETFEDIPWWRDEFLCELVEGWAGWSRFAFFDTDIGEFFYINRQSGVEVNEGVWASNDYSLKPSRRWATTSKFAGFGRFSGYAYDEDKEPSEDELLALELEEAEVVG